MRSDILDVSLHFCHCFELCLALGGLKVLNLQQSVMNRLWALRATEGTHLFLNAILESLELVQDFTSRSFAIGLLATEAIQLSTKHVPPVIPWFRLGNQRYFFLHGSLTSVSD